MDALEKELIKKAQRGNAKAYETLILRYESRIYAIALKVFKNETDAYDVAQEICLKLYQKISGFRFESEFSTWLHRLALNTAIDEYRKYKRKAQRELSYDKPLSETNETTSYKDSIEDPKASVEDKIIHKQERKLVWQGLEALEEAQKELLIMRDIEGHSYQEISEFLKINLGTVKSRISRARVALKDKIQEILEQGLT